MPATRFPERSQPSDRVAGFMAHLRLNGLSAGVTETEAALRALAHLPPNASEARLALKAICATDAETHKTFDDLFNAYWLNPGRIREDARMTSNNTHRRSLSNKNTLDSAASGSAGEEKTPDPNGQGEAESSGTGKLIASQYTNIAHTDFREFTRPEDMARAEAAAAQLARAIKDRRSRRRRAAAKGQALDFRRITRTSLATGGAPLKLYRKARPDRPVHLTALLDVSGSMSLYARVFMAFLKGLMNHDLRTDAFLFHTRLLCISEALREGNTTKAADRLTLMADGFGGGTKIGANIKAFNDTYARNRINARSVILILSDGYDTGPATEIAEALARLKKRGPRIIWLNPLKGWKDYAPIANGMSAALPHLDLFAAANTLNALAALEPELARL